MWLSHRFNFSNVTIAEYTLIITYIHVAMVAYVHALVAFSIKYIVKVNICILRI